MVSLILLVISNKSDNIDISNKSVTLSNNESDSLITNHKSHTLITNNSNKSIALISNKSDARRSYFVGLKVGLKSSGRHGWF